MVKTGIKFDGRELLLQLGKLQEAATTDLRPVSQAGAQVLYDETKQRASVIRSKEPHYFTSKSGKRYGPFQPGNLAASIYQVFSFDKSNPNVATYHISWNTRRGKAIAYAPYGWMVENGTSRTAANPFLRPAYDAKIGDALKAANAKWVEQTRAKLAKVN